MSKMGRPKRPDCCETCRFWDSLDATGGYCRRLPPVFVLNDFGPVQREDMERDSRLLGESPSDDLQGQWPSTEPDDWCGEWKEKPQ